MEGKGTAREEGKERKELDGKITVLGEGRKEGRKGREKKSEKYIKGGTMGKRNEREKRGRKKC